MIGLDFPLKLEWIYAVLNLWEPNLPVSKLIERSLANAMLEVSGEKTRRNSLSIILRIFVPMSQGNNQSRSTTEQNIWVAFAKHQSSLSLAPAFLARIIAESEVAQALSQHITRRYKTGSSFTSNDIQNFAASKFGERKVVSNAASAFLTTLRSFGVLIPGEGRSKHIVQPALSVSQEVFPLVIWAWWQQNPVPQFNPEAFEDLPSYQWLERENFSQFLRRFQPSLWSISERLDSQFITFKYPDSTDFEKKIIELV